METIHNPNVSNEIRIEAQKVFRFLEFFSFHLNIIFIVFILSLQFCNSIKDDFMAPLYGQLLADKKNQRSDFVRYFGLQLLENTIKFKWDDGTYDEKERERIKKRIIELVDEVYLLSNLCIGFCM